MTKFVAYYRVSTDRQGLSGLGLDAQRTTVLAHTANGQLIAEYTEVESGVSNATVRTERKYTAESAYRFWTERGCPHGSPEVDWFKAEQRMREDQNMSIGSWADVPVLLTHSGQEAGF